MPGIKNEDDIGPPAADDAAAIADIEMEDVECRRLLWVDDGEDRVDDAAAAPSSLFRPDLSDLVLPPSVLLVPRVLPPSTRL